MSSIDYLIEFCLLHDKEIQAAIEEKRLDPATARQGGGGHAFVSNPTEQKAIRNCSEVPAVEVPYGAFCNGKRDVMTVRRPEKWLRTVEIVVEHYDGNKQGDILKLKKQGFNRKEIAEAIGVSKTIYHVMYNDILTFARGVATGIGLLAPKH